MTLADRLELLEHERAIHALVHRYGRLIDEGADPEEIAALFTEDGVWSVEPGFSARHGRADIRKHFATVGSSVAPPTIHAVSSPEIDVAPGGRTATGRWYTLTLLTMAADGAVVLLGATSHHDYANVDGRWHFERLRTTVQFELPVGDTDQSKGA
jgi:ketosteroid isomerase-like protein